MPTSDSSAATGTGIGGDIARSGRSPDWLKMKNLACEAARREAEEDWGR
jgi:hypothetical protein